MTVFGLGILVYGIVLVALFGWYSVASWRWMRATGVMSELAAMKDIRSLARLPSSAVNSWRSFFTRADDPALEALRIRAARRFQLGVAFPFLGLLIPIVLQIGAVSAITFPRSLGPFGYGLWIVHVVVLLFVVIRLASAVREVGSGARLGQIVGPLVSGVVLTAAWLVEVVVLG